MAAIGAAQSSSHVQTTAAPAAATILVIDAPLVAHDVGLESPSVSETIAVVVPPPDLVLPDTGAPAQPAASTTATAAAAVSVAPVTAAAIVDAAPAQPFAAGAVGAPVTPVIIPAAAVSAPPTAVGNTGGVDSASAQLAAAGTAAPAKAPPAPAQTIDKGIIAARSEGTSSREVVASDHTDMMSMRELALAKTPLSNNNRFATYSPTELRHTRLVAQATAQMAATGQAFYTTPVSAAWLNYPELNARKADVFVRASEQFSSVVAPSALLACALSGQARALPLSLTIQESLDLLKDPAHIGP